MAGTINPTHRQARQRLIAASIAGAACISLLLAAPAQALSPSHAERPATAGAPPADFGGQSASSEARQVADWIFETGDNRGAPFIIVDKKAAQVFVFDDQGMLSGATTALLGLARGDDSAPGIGERKLADIPPEQRTTPAGRFVASMGLNLANQDILWVDYSTALALHRVLGANTPQSRLERLSGASLSDRRITFGCINVPVEFYEDVVRPQFLGRTGVVYILPETKSLQEVFFQASAASLPNG